MWLAPHGWGNGAILLLLIALFVLVDGMVSFEKSRLGAAPSQERGLTRQFRATDFTLVLKKCEQSFRFLRARRSCMNLITVSSPLPV
jgi:hypothetical protein